MKKRYLALILIPFLAGCGTSGNKSGQVEPVPVAEEQPVTKEDTVYLGLLSEKSYDPSSDVTFTVSVDDESVVTYSDKTIYSKAKEGSTVIHFVSDMLTYNVTVYVQDDYTVPSFRLDDSNVIMNTDADYQVNATLTYRDEDAFSYCDGLKLTNETNTGASTAVVSGNAISIHGNSAGKDTYTVYTTIFGHTLSKPLTVQVKEDNSIVIVGNRLTYSDVGPEYDVSLYKYGENPIDLSTDLSITKGGAPVSYSAVSVVSNDESVVSLSGSVLNPKKSGEASLTLSCDGTSIDIAVSVYKPVLDTKSIVLEDDEFSLDVGLEIDKSAKTRTYVHNDGVTKTVELPNDGYSFSGVSAVSIDGTALKKDSLQHVSASGRTLTFDSKAFSADLYGEHEVSVTADEDTYAVTYTFTMTFITKTISKYVDYRDYVTTVFEGDTVFGYFVLANDIDSGGWSSSSYVPNAAISSIGFRGTLDGNGHSINNFNATPYGINITVGTGAVIKNITYNVTKFNSGNGSGVLGRFIYGASFENITINMPSDAVTDVRLDSDSLGIGVFSTQKVNDCTFSNVTVNASGLNLVSLCGKNSSGNYYDGVKVYCASLPYESTMPYKAIDSVTGIEVINE